jgi:hypothetical protein
MSAGKGKSLSPAFLANTWRPGQSGNPGGHSGLYGEAVKLARGLSLRAVQRLGELMESEDERVSVVACNALLDRAFGKPKPIEEPKDDMDAQLASMSREERLALMNNLLEPMRRYLPLDEDVGPAVARGEADQDRIGCRGEDRRHT